jgi:tagatose 6-phosphate kinase
MIIAVSLDPVMHVSYHTKRIVPGTTHHVGPVRYRAGGRGPAVARMLHTFGHEVAAAGLAGGTAGELIRAELARCGVPTQFTRIAAESRRLVEVTDAETGTTTSFAEPSPYITTEELGRLAADYRDLLDGASAAVLCGGLPDGLPPETYATFATYAAEAGVPVVLDAGAAALWPAAARHPALVIPEPGGAEPGGSGVVGSGVVGSGVVGSGVVGSGGVGPGGVGSGVVGSGALAAGTGTEAWSEAGLRRLLAAGAGAVTTMSGDVVEVLTATGRWRARLPGSPPMSRDALVAGLVPGVALGWSWPESLQHAVSLAASAAPAGDPDLVAYEQLLPQVIIESS